MNVVRETTKSTQFFRTVVTLAARGTSLDTIGISYLSLIILINDTPFWSSIIPHIHRPAITIQKWHLCITSGGGGIP